jgi:uncharacterized membrane protein YgaE (UPF0421/DUF939 family)
VTFLLAVVLWFLLAAIAWPIALLLLILLPFLWLLSLPFRLLGAVVGGVFAFIKALLFLPARLLGYKSG